MIDPDQRLEPPKPRPRCKIPDDPLRRLCRRRPDFTPPFRRVFWKTLGLTLLLLVLVFVAAETALAHFLVLPTHWLATSLTLLAAVALLVGFAFAITPVSFLVAGFFFDERCRHRRSGNRPAASGSGGAARPADRVSVVFALLALALNIVALALLLVPGVNAFIFLIVQRLSTWAWLFRAGRSAPSARPRISRACAGGMNCRFFSPGCLSPRWRRCRSPIC